MQLAFRLQFGKTRLVNLLLRIKHVEQRAGTEVKVLLLIQFARAFAKLLLPTKDL